jgi:hypothetical protein
MRRIGSAAAVLLSVLAGFAATGAVWATGDDDRLALLVGSGVSSALLMARWPATALLWPLVLLAEWLFWPAT